jgi:predicted MFS family arabinose efflux permease
MVFLVDYVARYLGRGIHAGSLCWITFGMGAVIGPLISGHIGDRIGFRATLRWALLIQAVAVAVVLIASGPILLVSSFIIGAFVPGIVAITIGRTRELIRNDPTAQAAAWGYCTTAFAIGQGAAAYAFSFIFSHVGNAYPVLFVSASIALMVALSIDFAANLITSARPYHGRSKTAGNLDS